MKTVSTVLALCLIVLATKAQNVREQTLVWEYNSLVNGRSQETLQRSGTLTTYGESKIVWTQDDNYVQSFSVESVSGTWNNVLQDGELTYRVHIGESNGTIKVQRHATSIQIQIDLTRPGRPASNFQFSVSNVHP